METFDFNFNLIDFPEPSKGWLSSFVKQIKPDNKVFFTNKTIEGNYILFDFYV